MMSVAKREGGLTQSLKNTWLHPRYLAINALQQAIRQLAPSAKGHLLDIGCGKKPYVGLFAPYVTSYIGVDVASTMHGLEMVDAVASSLTLPFAAAAFDTILTTEVIEHVPEPSQMLSEICRVLRPGGVLILSAPFHEPLHELPYDFFRYTDIALRGMLEKQGLHVLEVNRRGGSLLVSTYLLCSFLYRKFGIRGYPDRLQVNPVLGPFVVAICAIMQMIGGSLDTIINDEFDTLGFVVLAEKPMSNPQ